MIAKFETVQSPFRLQVQRALDAEEHQRLKIQRDADSDNWKKGHEAAQDAVCCHCSVLGPKGDHSGQVPAL